MILYRFLIFIIFLVLLIEESLSIANFDDESLKNIKEVEPKIKIEKGFQWTDLLKYFQFRHENNHNIEIQYNISSNFTSEQREVLKDVISTMETLIQRKYNITFKINIKVEKLLSQTYEIQSIIYRGNYSLVLDLFNDFVTTDFWTNLPENDSSYFERLFNFPSGYTWNKYFLLPEWQCYGLSLSGGYLSIVNLTIDPRFLENSDSTPLDGCDPDKYDFRTVMFRPFFQLFGFFSDLDFMGIYRPETYITLFDSYRFNYTDVSEMNSLDTDIRQLDPTISPHVFWDGELKVPVPLEQGPLNPNSDKDEARNWLNDNGHYFGVVNGMKKGIQIGISPNDVSAIAAFGFPRIDPLIPKIRKVEVSGEKFKILADFLSSTTVAKFVSKSGQETIIQSEEGDPSENRFLYLNFISPVSFVSEGGNVYLSNDGSNWSEPWKQNGKDNESSSSSSLKSMKILYSFLSIMITYSLFFDLI